MSDLSIGSNNIVSLEGALMIYSSGYSEYRPIKKNKFLGAKPLSVEVIEHLIESYLPPNNKMEFKGIIPNKVVMASSGANFKLMWRVPAGKYNLVFSDQEHDGEYTLPNMLFCIENKGLYVYCYKKWKGKRTKFFDGCFPNVADGRMCMGTADLHLANCESFEKAMKNGEAAFFGSKFSHQITKLLLESKGKDSFIYPKKVSNEKRIF